MKYSFIIPVFNRPNEVDELLQSLTTQTLKDFDVLVVEDGSTLPCQDVVARYASQLAIHYYNKPNSGPGQTRNYGVQRATGEYVLILDSDVVLPPGYLAAVDAELTANPCDAFGGPDRAHKDFSPTQKAINYAMTSFFTTGGIRGGKKKMDKFYPRSFNMGVRREVYNALNGFSEMRFGEDIDFSTRIFEGGHSCRLFPEAWVWHKRRTDLKKFSSKCTTRALHASICQNATPAHSNWYTPCRPYSQPAAPCLLCWLSSQPFVAVHIGGSCCCPLHCLPSSSAPMPHVQNAVLA